MSRAEAAQILNTVPHELTNRLQWQWDGESNFITLLGQPCPFLSATKDCAIYEIRPYNCRRFMCLRDAGEPFERGATHNGCFNLDDRLAQSNIARRQYRKNERHARKWAMAFGWDLTTAETSVK